MGAELEEAHLLGVGRRLERLQAQLDEPAREVDALQSQPHEVDEQRRVERRRRGPEAVGPEGGRLCGARFEAELQQELSHQRVPLAHDHEHLIEHAFYAEQQAMCVVLEEVEQHPHPRGHHLGHRRQPIARLRGESR